MAQCSRFPIASTLLAVIVAGSLAPRAYASGFQLREQSASAQGNAFAGISAGGEDISSMFFNPASMTRIDGLQCILGGSRIVPVATFSDGQATRAPIFPDAQRSISGSTSCSNSAKAVTIPNIATMWTLSETLNLGLSINAPFGMATEYGMDFIGRYHALKSDLKTLDIAPAIAWRIDPQWSAGLAIVARKADAEISNAVDFGMIAASKGVPGYTPGGSDGTATLKGSKWGYGYRLGVTFQPIEPLYLGFAYHSATKMNLKGTLTYSDVPTILSSTFRDSDATAELDLPATTSLGADYRFSDKLDLKAELARTEWSCFKELRVKIASGQPDVVTVENWHDTWFFSVGGTYRLNDTTALRAGLAFDQGAAREATRTPRIPDGDRTWISLGVSQAFTTHFSVDLGYTHIFVKQPNIGLASGTSSDSPDFYCGNLSGKFSNHIDILAIQGKFTF